MLSLHSTKRKFNTRFITYRCNFQILVIFNNIEQQGTLLSCDDVVPLRTNTFNVNIVLHGFNLDNLHQLFNIHPFPPKDQIMEKITNIEHIKQSLYAILFSSNVF
jgi:hypothetical protein